MRPRTRSTPLRNHAGRHDQQQSDAIERKKVIAQIGKPKILCRRTDAGWCGCGCQPGWVARQCHHLTPGLQIAEQCQHRQQYRTGEQRGT